jgi:PAS domain S-box-containing protein/putative nucleotidyltransferase with HDIG domain
LIIENQRLHEALEKETLERKLMEDVLQRNEQISRELAETALRQAQELTLLDRVRSTIAAKLDMPVLLKSVVESIAEVYGYTHVSVYLLEGDMLTLQHQVGYRSVIEKISVNKGISGKVARTGQPILIEDVTASPDFLGAAANIVSEITIPLMDNDRIVGTLSVESASKLTEADLKILVALSGNVSMAIGRARLYEDIQRRNRTLSALQESMIAIMGELSLSDALRAILAQAAQLINTSHGYIYLIQPDNTLQLMTGMGVYPQYVGLTIEMGEGLAGKVWQFSQPMVINDYMQWEGRSAKFSGSPFYAVMGIPLLRNSQVIGVLGLAHLTPDCTFNESDLELLSRFAQLASIAIDNAGLYTQIHQELEERKQADQRLRASEERLAAVMEGSQLGYSDWNIQTGEVQRNERWANMLGYTLNELTANLSQWDELLHPDDRERAKKSIQDHLDCKTAVHRDEYRLRTKDGSYRWILDQGRIIEYDEQGRPLRLTATHTDITERKQAEQELLTSEQHFRSIFEQSPIGMGLIDTQSGKFLQVNPRYCEITGRTSVEMLALTFNEITHPDDLNISIDNNLRMIEGTIHHFDFEKRYIRPDQSIVWVHLTVVALWNRQDDPRINLTMVEDITEKKQAELALRKSEQRLQAFFNQSLDGFFFCDFEEPIEWKRTSNKDETLEYIIATKRFTEVNDAMLNQYGISRETFLSLTTKDIFAHDIEQGRSLRRELFDKGHLHLETYERTGDGTPIWFEGDYVCLHDPLKRITGYFGIQRDVTERKQAESELRRHVQNTITMYELSQSIHIWLELDQVYKAAHNAVQKLMPCDSFLIALLDAKLNEIEDVYLWDKGKRWEGGRHPLGDGLTSYVISTAKPFFVNEWTDAHTEMTRTLQFGDTEIDTNSVLAVPLFATDGSCFGMMTAQAYSTQAYAPEDEQLLITLANQVSKAIENANLFAEVQQELAERKRTEQALRESEERYRTLFADMLDGVYRSTHDGRFLDVNPAMIRMFGYTSREDMLAVDIRKDLYFTPEDRNSLFLDTGQEKVDEFRMKRKDGSEIWVEDHGRYVHDEHGNAIYHEGILRDITERKRAEDAIRATEEKYRSIFENSVEGIYQSTPEGHFYTVNPAFANMLGYASPQDLIDSITDIATQLYYDTHRRRDFMRQLEEQGSISNFEYQMRRKDGKLVWVSENARLVRDVSGKVSYYEGILEDITARKQNEQLIDNQLKQLNALHTIDNAINSNFDLRMTLEVLLKEVIAQLKVDATSVLLFNRDTHTLDYTAGRGFVSKATQHTKLSAGEGYAGRVILDRKIIHIPDLTKTENNRLTDALNLAGENFVAYVGSPLIAKGQVVGVLEIFQRSPLAPDPDWFEFLSMIADQAAIAIENAQLFENLQRSNFELTLAYDATIEGWSRALDLRDRETEGHTQRVTNLTLKLARQMGIPDTDILHIRRGALLHDIGKMGIPDSILHKPDKLTPEEWNIMRQHTIYAYQMLTPIKYLQPALDIPRYHHEKWDGTGYPNGTCLKNVILPAPCSRHA